MKEIMLVKQLNGSLMPAYDSDKETLKAFKAGEPFFCKLHKRRNISHHRKTFALFNMVFQNQEIYKSLDDLRYDLTIEAGYFNEGVNIHGEVVKRAKSISFAQMDQVEFNEYYEAIIKTIVLYFHFDREDIIENVSQYF